jgi:hypothetical protein
VLLTRFFVFVWQVILALQEQSRSHAGAFAEHPPAQGKKSDDEDDDEDEVDDDDDGDARFVAVLPADAHEARAHTRIHSLAHTHSLIRTHTLARSLPAPPPPPPSLSHTHSLSRAHTVQ